MRDEDVEARPLDLGSGPRGGLSPRSFAAGSRSPLTASPHRASYGAVPVGSNVPMIIQFTNSGTQPVTLGTFNLSGDDGLPSHRTQPHTGFLASSRGYLQHRGDVSSLSKDRNPHALGEHLCYGGRGSAERARGVKPPSPSARGRRKSLS